MTIWKFQVPIGGPVEMPQDARLLAVGVQGGVLTVWALVDPEAPTVPRQLFVYGTGHPMADEPGEYVGTARTGGQLELVWHVFDGGER